MERLAADRRRFLALAGSTAFAGCSGLSPSNDGEDAETTTPTRRKPPLGDPAPEGSWPTVGRNRARTAADPTTTAAAPSLAWTQSLAGPTTVPIVVGNTVYHTRGAPSDGVAEATLEAFALDTGERRWSEPLGRSFEGVESRPTYHRGTLFLVAGRVALAVDAASRERYWVTRFEDREYTDSRGRSETESHWVLGPVAATDDGLFVGDALGGLVCLNRDGTERWRHGSKPYMYWPPTVVDGTAYAEGLTALDTADGSVQWRYTPDDGPVAGGPVSVADGAVFRSGRDVVDAVTLDGSRRWARETFTDGGVRPAVDGERLYVADNDGNAAAFSLDSGERVWGTQLYDDVGPSRTVPVVVDGAFLVCYAVDGRVTVTALDTETGEQRWQLERRAKTGGGTVSSDGTVLFTTKTPPDPEGSVTPDRSTADPTGTTTRLYAFRHDA
ncbi:Outer membrane protein assembly factor BamB, contains PQQ-like beta-propeller repeat [Halogranum rubrum]|uniref:Outer membrane protein assembly factor BamB, contains PQQ-like beta-propeller repeat n=1 Tax=Halogranum rubrum TaxID=553466 RepID=A0A1I4AUB8_9EURY|nr:PQQ-binding-like beta-propeller repeat protein [Halogranum rubrum]SFK60004.1 Outer membrane protein assembly factor BamB, contains PQQ-like beta-propeller repeat [Halogranum rubrum]